MGLDMYLYASRRFDPTSFEGMQILGIAQTPAAALEAMSRLDPYEHETTIYLPMWSFSDPDERSRAGSIQAAAGLLPLATDDSAGGHLAWRDGRLEVSITCAYWRKANAVHGWFVRECQNGVDECQVSEVHPEQLAKLRADCLGAIAAFNEGRTADAEEIMSPTGGFFFGSYDVDQWWADTLHNTVIEIDRIVSLAVEIGGVEFAYHSSW